MSLKNMLKNFVFLCLITVTTGVLSSCTPAKWTKEDFPKLEQAARRGDAKAQLLVGELYEFGVDVPADGLIAAKWYEMAANQNDPEGLLYLGMMRGSAVQQVTESVPALNRLFQSAELGDERAQVGLALLFFKDKGLRREIVRRIENYQQRARRGEAAAQYAMGWVFREGVGLKINPREAMSWYHSSASQGYAKAQMALGKIYMEGKVAPLDLDRAAQWFEQCAQSSFAARVQLSGLRNDDAGWQTKSGSEDLLRFADESLRLYIRVRRMFIESATDTNNPLVLRSCRSLQELDPDYGGISAVCGPAAANNSETTRSRVEAAMQALRAADDDRFGTIVSGLMTPDFDQEQTRRLIAFAWKVLDKETEAARRNIEAQLKQLETAGRNETYRRNNARLIPVWMDAFTTAVARAQRENPGDTSLAALAVRGGQVMSILQQQMKQQKQAEPKKPAAGKKPQEPEVFPGEDEYKMAQEIFAQGRFQDAADIFEKTTRIRGFRHIAQSYIYMGICNLALINPANVSQARQLRLKGIVCFQNALRFDRRASLPVGYGKYEPVFDEAKKKMK